MKLNALINFFSKPKGVVLCTCLSELKLHSKDQITGKVLSAPTVSSYSHWWLLTHTVSMELFTWVSVFQYKGSQACPLSRFQSFEEAFLEIDFRYPILRTAVSSFPVWLINFFLSNPPGLVYNKLSQFLSSLYFCNPIDLKRTHGTGSNISKINSILSLLKQWLKQSGPDF